MHMSHPLNDLGLESLLRESAVNFQFFESSRGVGGGGSSAMSSTILSSPIAAASLLATSIRCIDSGMLPQSEGVPTGALVASKRKLICTLAGASSGGISGDMLAASEVYESAVRISFLVQHRR